MANNNRYNAQQPAQPKSKTFLAVVATILVFAIATVALVGVYSKGFADWTKFKLSDNDPIVEVPEGVSEADNLDFKFSNSSKVRLATTATAVNAEGFPTKTLTATVLPATARNKAVDWSVRWQNPGSKFAAGKTVTDYITAVPNEDGSNVVTVTCIKAFLGEKILVRVTTRDGGLTLDCTATFLGRPTSMAIDTSSVDVIHDSGWDVDIVDVPGDRDSATHYKNLPITFSNIFNCVDPNFVPTFEKTMLGIGTFIVAGRVEKDETGEKITDLSNLEVNMLYEFTTLLNPECTFYFTDVKDSVFRYRTWQARCVNDFEIAFPVKIPGQGVYDNYTEFRTFLKFTDVNKLPYLQITIAETSLKLSTKVNLRTYRLVDNIDIDSPEIEF